MMMNCFFGMVDQQKAFSLISTMANLRHVASRVEPVQILSSGLVEWGCAVVLTTTSPQTNLDVFEWSCAVVLTTTPRRHKQI